MTPLARLAPKGANLQFPKPRPQLAIISPTVTTAIDIEKLIPNMPLYLHQRVQANILTIIDIRSFPFFGYSRSNEATIPNCITRITLSQVISFNQMKNKKTLNNLSVIVISLDLKI